MATFDLTTAKAELAELRPAIEELIMLRADAAELASSLGHEGAATPLGGLPELKAAQARLDELVTSIQQSGAELKGLAPLLLDFPAELDGVPVYLCWLEGEPDIGWYHRRDLGLAGRRPLP